MAQDLYSALGVNRKASDDEIKKAYRRLARKHHPDVNPGDTASEERFKEVNSAFEVLGDPQKRKLYDEFGDDALRMGFDPEKARAYRTWQAHPGGGGGPEINLEDIFGPGAGGAQHRGGGFSFDNLGDVLSDLFGGGRRQGGPQPGPPPPPRNIPGDDVDANLSIDFLEAALGTKKDLTVNRPDANGRITPVHLSVTIPVGVPDGQKIRLTGQGMPSPTGGRPGNLYVRVKVRRHRHFDRQGDDIHLELPITVAEALEGARIEVPTLTSRVTLSIPPGSQSGKRLRLKGKGIPARKKKPAGDMFVELKIVVPEGAETNEKAVEAARALDPLYGKIREDL